MCHREPFKCIIGKSLCIVLFLLVEVYQSKGLSASEENFYDVIGKRRVHLRKRFECKFITEQSSGAGPGDRSSASEDKFKCIRAPGIFYAKKNVLEHAVFLLKSLVLRSERTKPVFKNVQKHLYDPKHVLLCIIFLHARKLHRS